MTVQNVSGEAKSGFGEDLADSVTIENPADDGDQDDDNPGGELPVDPAAEGDNPDH